MSKDSFFLDRAKSFKYAFRGLWYLFLYENSIKAHLTISIAMTLLGLYVDLSPTEWMFQTLSIGLVIATEGMNSALEKLADFVEANHHPKIGVVKDMAAGAVMVTAIAAVVVGAIIYIPKF